MKIFQVPGMLTKVTSMSNSSLRLQFDTQENIRGDEMSLLFSYLNQIGWMTINVSQIEAEDIVNLPELKKTDQQKSPSQRLRGVLYRKWENNSEGYQEFESYYLMMMEKLINHFKEQIN